MSRICKVSPVPKHHCNDKFIGGKNYDIHFPNCSRKKSWINKFTSIYRVVAKPTLLYGSEIWVTTKRDMIGLEAAELRLLRSVKWYTILDKIRSEIIRKELEIPGIQDVRTKYEQNWVNYLEGIDNNRLSEHPFNCKPRGRRYHGRPRKRWQRIDAGTGQTI